MPDFIRYFYDSHEEPASDSASDTASESDDDTESVNIVSQNGKNNIVLCEIFNPSMHGFTSESDQNVIGHYLVIGKYPMDSIYFNNSYIRDVINNYQSNIRELLLSPNYCRHPWIRNYKNIAARNNYIRPEIAECIILSGNETVAILKTFWLRIVQRTWKRVFRERCNILNIRKTMYALYFRQIHGSWPANCARLPELKGML